MHNHDQSEILQQKVKHAFETGDALRIVGANTKIFFGNDCTNNNRADELSVKDHSGIIAYEPSELFITVRAGTALSEIEALLDKQGQMLPFEPPHFGEGATIGGTIACGFSGPRRPFAGAARDVILGCKILNGKGEILSFGGQVMKNVAGYDVTRLMVGAMGVLGVLLEVTIKVLPKPEFEASLAQALSTQEALDVMCARASKPLPLSAASYDGEAMVLRFSGTEVAVKAAMSKMGGNELQAGDEYWQGVKEHSHHFFQSSLPLWRLSLAQATLPIDLPGQWLFDWGGALRWLMCDAPIKQIQDATEMEGGHATLFRGREFYQGQDLEDSSGNSSGNSSEKSVDVFHPLSKPLLIIHQKLKVAFDPKSILNPGRFHANID